MDLLRTIADRKTLSCHVLHGTCKGFPPEDSQRKLMMLLYKPFCFSTSSTCLACNPKGRGYKVVELQPLLIKFHKIAFFFFFTFQLIKLRSKQEKMENLWFKKKRVLLRTSMVVYKNGTFIYFTADFYSSCSSISLYFLHLKSQWMHTSCSNESNLNSGLFSSKNRDA